MKLLALIPARGGSKGIPDKNIALLNGKPLILHTLSVAEKAVENGVISKVLISTDSEKIRNTILENSPHTECITRPEEYSTDSAKTIDVVIHAIESEAQKGNQFDAVLLLQATSPLRNVEDIESSTKLFKTGNSKSLISLYEEHTINETILYRSEGDYAKCISPNHNKGVRRQDHGPMLVRNGAIYICETNYLLENKSLICATPLAYRMPKGRSVNIDTLEDLQIAEKLLTV